MLKRCIKLISPFIMTAALLTACNTNSDMEKSKTQQRVDKLSNKINTNYQKTNNSVKKDGKVHRRGVVKDRESRKMTNQ